MSRDEATRQHLLTALDQTGWNVSRTAARLGIARNTVYAHMEKFALRADPSGKTTPRRHRRAEPAVAPPLTDTRLQWERRSIALLRVALGGAESDDASSQTSRALEAVIAKVHSFGGRVEDVTPVGLVAAFGLDPIEEAPRRAAHAAMAIQQAAQRARENNETVPGITIGLHVAPLVIGRVGARVEIDADAKREQWQVMDLLLQMIDPGGTVASAAAAPFLERRFELVPLEAVDEGLGQCYRLTGQERRGLGLWGVTTRFVGRREELEALQSRLTSALSGHGQVVAVVGEPGVGKSRLFYQFTHSSRLDGRLVLESASASYGKAMSYLPVVGLLKGYFKIQDRDDLREVREKVTGKLLTLDEALKPILPALLDLLDVPVDDTAWRTLDPVQRRQRTLDAVKQLLRREAREQPLLLIFEDLHWVDGETQALLDGLVESLATTRTLLLVNYRPEYHHSWGSKTYYSQLRLDALPVEGAGELLDALLGEDPGLAPLKQLLVKRGNPFFLEETVRALVETKALAGERGRYRPAQPVQVIQVPPTVDAILAARIDRLPPEDKHLLRVASVVGKDVPFALLQAIAELPDEALRRGLDHLQAAEFIYEAGLSPDIEYSFKHALTHDVAYGGLVREGRRALHAKIVDAIERLHEGRLAEHVDRLAHHAFRGELWDQAVHYLRQAGTKAAERSALRAAVAWFEQALMALPHLAQSRGQLQEAVDIRLELRGALFALGDFDRLLANLRAAEGTAEALDDPGRSGWVSCFLASYFWITGSPERAIAPAQDARTAGEALGDLSLQVSASYFQGLAHYSRGEYCQATDFFTCIGGTLTSERIRERCGQPGLHAVFARTWLVFCRTERGEFDKAVETAREAMEIAETANHPYTLTVACWAVGDVHLKKGELADAIRALERALQLCREWNFRALLPSIADLLGYAHALSSALPASLALLEEAEEQSRGIRHPRSQLLAHLSEAYRHAGRIEDALRVASQALALSREYGERGSEAWSLRFVAENAAHRGDSQIAEDHYRLALLLAMDLEMRPLVAHCHLGLGTLFRKTGQLDHARGHLTTATTMLRDMGMSHWLEQAEAELVAFS